MSDKVKIQLSNDEAASQTISEAIMLLSQKSFGYKLAWFISDIQDAVKKQSKAYNEGLLNLAKAYGGTPKGTGYVFDEDNPVPDEFTVEAQKLGDEVVEHEFELIELPEEITKTVNGKKITEKVSYEPVIFIGLRKFIKRNEEPQE